MACGSDGHAAMIRARSVSGLDPDFSETRRNRSAFRSACLPFCVFPGDYRDCANPILSVFYRLFGFQFFGWSSGSTPEATPPIQILDAGAIPAELRYWPRIRGNHCCVETYNSDSTKPLQVKTTDALRFTVRGYCAGLPLNCDFGNMGNVTMALIG